jgi:hypothetical protein
MWVGRGLDEGTTLSEKGKCLPTEVSREQLLELEDLCERLLEKKDCEEAAESLPLPDGFSWDDPETAENYWWQMEATIRQLKAVLHTGHFNDWSFSYRSSW